LDLQKILSDLTAEKDRIVRAIEALLESPSKPGPKKGVKRPRATGRRRGAITPEGRRRLSIAMKKRWAERKRKNPKLSRNMDFTSIAPWLLKTPVI